MTQQIANQQQPLTVKSLFARADVKNKFEEMLGKNSAQFVASVLQIVASSALLGNADPMSVYQAASLAATLNLPLNNNLGFAYIVPYNQRYQENGQWKTKQVAQFQIGYKGFIQLSLRSGQFKGLSAAPIYEGQLVKQNPLTGFEFDFEPRTSDKVIGYASYFSLINGFEKTLYMSVDQVKAHAQAYSQTYQKGTGNWKDRFEEMATKTVLKQLLSKYAPMSIEMQNAVIADQAVINNADTFDVTYADNQPDEGQTEEETTLQRVKEMLLDCTTPEEVDQIKQRPTGTEQLFLNRKKQLQDERNK